jgi:NADH:ubiquinone oxidoreductase subunit 5 (subunit L)/multisubunit Na+/H+ antiporter MnhA subunit
MGGLSIYMPFTSSSLIVSNFALCCMPFLAGFYSRDFILEMFSMRYVNMFGFFLLFLSTGLTVCCSFRLFYFVLCGDFNFVPSYSMVETSYNIPGTSLCYWLSRAQGQNAAERIMSIKNSNETIGNRTRDLTACGAVP